MGRMESAIAALISVRDELDLGERKRNQVVAEKEREIDEFLKTAYSNLDRALLIDLQSLSKAFYFPVLIENVLVNKINKFEISRGHDEFCDHFGFQGTFFEFDFVGFKKGISSFVIHKNYQSYASALGLAGVVGCKPVVFLRGGLAYRFSSNSGSDFSVIESRYDYVDEVGESYFIQPLSADFVATHPDFLGVDNVIISSVSSSFNALNLPRG